MKRKYTRNQKSNWCLTFQNVLNDPEGQYAFEIFLRKNYPNLMLTFYTVKLCHHVLPKTDAMVEEPVNILAEIKERVTYLIKDKTVGVNDCQLENLSAATSKEDITSALRDIKTHLTATLNTDCYGQFQEWLQDAYTTNNDAGCSPCIMS